MTASPISQLALIALAAAVAPVLAEVSGRLAIPGVVIEIALGILIGPSVLRWTSPGELITTLSNFGLALLMFLAGYELDLPLIRGRPLRMAGVSWACSLALATAVGLVLLVSGHRHGEIVTGLALSTTALGTLLPVLRDSGVLDTALGRHILSVGSVGEFGPIVLVALALSGQDPGLTGLLLLAFGLLAVVSIYAARRPWGSRITGLVRRGLHSSSQLPVRLSILLIVAMVLLASQLGLDVLLGAFAAGLTVRTAVAGRENEAHIQIFRGKLEAIGFGFLVPVFFIVSGMRLELTTFTHHPMALLSIPVFFVLLLAVRGLPVLWCYRKELPRTQRSALALMAATGLPLIVVVTTIGQSDGYVSAGHAAALVTAGMLSVLLLPAFGLRLLHVNRTGPPMEDADRL